MPARRAPFNWNCPFCNHHSTIQGKDYKYNILPLQEDEVDRGQMALEMHSIRCPNQQCGRVTVWAERSTITQQTMGMLPNRALDLWNLIPPSEAKTFPEYVPEPIRKDYEEACLIRDLSPKASATLSRRCLQGMIRDYWKVSIPNLKQAIDAIEDKVDPLTWEAIQAVRKIGNIGAHMEKDINTIVDVDSNEAQLLTELIEQLIDDWYIANYEREERLKRLKDLAVDKDAVREKAQGDK